MGAFIIGTPAFHVGEGIVCSRVPLLHGRYPVVCQNTIEPFRGTDVDKYAAP
jgi:hypothetical protein